ALALVGAGCGGSGGGDDGEVAAVATTTQVGDFVREVGGEGVEVEQLLQPNSDPHDYEPRPSDVQALAEADVVYASGEGLDEWIEEVVADSGTDAEVVDLGAVTPVRLPDDPHWWHDPRNAEAAVTEIARTLAAVDPARKARFQRNAVAYEKRLRALDAGIAACIETVPPADRKLVTDHDAFDYFAGRYGIEVVGAVIPSQTTQAQPSAKELSELADTVEAEGVRAIFPESSLSSKVAQAIADQTGVSAEYTLYGDTLGPEGSDGATYLQMEEANADAVVRGLTDGERGCSLSP
ncbi:MAG TPA: metal ABC transporter substrate-binding protein, partial [Solirubrobacterales bacterium]|nr:metal ABC transporter substrate-binding protein [Solirubrobacterales bacterium]